MSFFNLKFTSLTNFQNMQILNLWVIEKQLKKLLFQVEKRAAAIEIRIKILRELITTVKGKW